MELSFRNGKFVFLLSIIHLSFVMHATNPPEEEVISTSRRQAEEKTDPVASVPLVIYTSASGTFYFR